LYFYILLEMFQYTNSGIINVVPLKEHQKLQEQKTVLRQYLANVLNSNTFEQSHSTPAKPNQQYMDSPRVEGVVPSALRVTILSNSSDDPKPYFESFSQEEFFGITCPNCHYQQRETNYCPNCNYPLATNTYPMHAMQIPRANMPTMQMMVPSYNMSMPQQQPLPVQVMPPPQAQPKAPVNIQSLQAYFNVQPASFQIANYNVHPPLAMYYTLVSATPVTAEVSLVETTTKQELRNAFQSTSSFTVQPRSNMLQLNGLKLKKMGTLKSELKTKHLKDQQFVILVRIGDQTWETSPFKIVSNCNQLDPEVRNSVRPTKRPYSSSQDGEDVEDEELPEEKS